MTTGRELSAYVMSVYYTIGLKRSGQSPTQLKQRNKMYALEIILVTILLILLVTQNLLAQLCIRHELQMLTTDRDFRSISKITPLPVWQY